MFCRRGCRAWLVFTVFWWRCGWAHPACRGWTCWRSSCWWRCRLRLRRARTGTLGSTEYANILPCYITINQEANSLSSLPTLNTHQSAIYQSPINQLYSTSYCGFSHLPSYNSTIFSAGWHPAVSGTPTNRHASITDTAQKRIITGKCILLATLITSFMKIEGSEAKMQLKPRATAMICTGNSSVA